MAGFVIAPIYAQEEEAVILDEEPIVAEAEDVVAEDVVAEDVAAEEVAIDDELATEEAALEADDAIYYEDDENLEDFDFNSIFEDEDCISIQGCNSGKDFAELLGTEENAYDFLDKMKIGETIKNITRIW